MAGQPQQLPDDEGSEQAEKREAARRQQHVQHCGREHPIDRRNEKLRRGHRRCGQGQLETAEADRLTVDGRQHHVADADGDQHRTKRNPDGARQRQRIRQTADGQAQAAQQQQPQPECCRVRDDDAREIVGPESPARIEPVAHGSAGQHAEADVVGDGVREK